MMGGIKVLCNLQSEKIRVAVLQNTRIKNTFTKNYHLPGIEGRANILFEYSIYIYIYIYSFLGMAFAILFRCYFQKVQVLVIKKFWETFCYIVLLFLWAQKACLRFLKFSFKLDMLIYFSFVVSFLVDMFN